MKKLIFIILCMAFLLLCFVAYNENRHAIIMKEYKTGFSADFWDPEAADKSLKTNKSIWEIGSYE